MQNKVTQELQSFGYSPLPMPMSVAGIEFNFAASMTGPEGTLSLVVVVDEHEDANRLRQKVEALAQALDLRGSRRSLTVVLPDGVCGDAEIASLWRVSRVILIPNDEDAIASKMLLSDSLRIFKPITRPPEVQLSNADPLSRVAEILDKTSREQLASSGLGDSSLLGSSDVELTYRDWIRDGFALEDSST